MNNLSGNNNHTTSRLSPGFWAQRPSVFCRNNIVIIIMLKIVLNNNENYNNNKNSTNNTTC